MESGIALAWPLWAAAAGILFLAGITQGALGFGFPAISTPLLVLMTDVKTAIILNLLPNFTVNAVSTVSGGNWGASLGRYWPVAAWVLVGSGLGASFLILAPQEPVRLLLAVAIFAYLFQHRLAKLDWRWLGRRQRAAYPGRARGHVDRHAPAAANQPCDLRPPAALGAVRHRARAAMARDALFFTLIR